MYLHVGNNNLIRNKDIIAICDFDNVTSTKDGIAFLQKAEKERTINDMSGLLPKSFIITNDRFTGFKVYTSCLNTVTLRKRMTKRI